MKLEEPIKLERLARLHELLETKDYCQVRDQRRSDCFISRNRSLARYVVGYVVRECEGSIPFDEIGQRHFRKRGKEG